MNPAFSFPMALKAMRQLGVEQTGLYALYQLGIYSGHYGRQLKASLTKLNHLKGKKNLELHPCLSSLPNREEMLELLGDRVDQLYQQADEIVEGKVRLFGGNPVALKLSPPQPLMDWTAYEHGNNCIDGVDIKYIWEPGRFGWACILAMAYHLSNDEKYPDSFWSYTELFLSSNPPYWGPHWSSAQEVAIRIIALSFAIQVFGRSSLSTPERLNKIAQSFAEHAERISPTLVYARSQNNNHLVTEALGLYTASALLRKHPQAPIWHRMGRKWLQQGFKTQIDPDGTYTQHSTNYHRLMLLAALWAFTVQRTAFTNEPFPEEVTRRLQSATQWLLTLVDPKMGAAPNLGHNDGAYILPLTVCPYYDYRPIIHAAGRAFLQKNFIPQGIWSDMSNWLSCVIEPSTAATKIESKQDWQAPKDIALNPPHILHNPRNGSWAYIRVARFHSRPAHADQLHVDLWWRGLNIAQDPGTYLYNASQPWENSLTSTLVHNTLVVDGKECMRRSGRFLYLDWAQAIVTNIQTGPDGQIQSLTAQHDGYRKIGVTHSRNITARENGDWVITDQLLGSAGTNHTARLHWLLPDWEYELIGWSENTNLPGYAIRIHSPFGWIDLKINAEATTNSGLSSQQYKFQLIRAGALVSGSGSPLPISGWTSPTYGDKTPALACILEISQPLPIIIKSEWTLPHES